MNDIEIDSNKSRLDVNFINEFISETYWGKGRTLQMMQTCIDNSLNFGVYQNGKQIGYARVVTDYVQFAYIMDVFIDEKERGKGYSNKLMEHLMNCPQLKTVKVWRLASTNAQWLYKKFGFTALANPEKLMELIVR